MGESRKTSGGTDKYAGTITCFGAGISFDQPNVRITDGRRRPEQNQPFPRQHRSGIQIHPSRQGVTVIATQAIPAGPFNSSSMWMEAA